VEGEGRGGGNGGGGEAAAAVEVWVAAEVREEAVTAEEGGMAADWR